MRKIKNKFHPNVICHYIQQILTLPVNLMVKLLYPRVYRLDHLVIEDSEPNVYKCNFSVMLA